MSLPIYSAWSLVSPTKNTMLSRRTNNCEKNAVACNENNFIPNQVISVVKKIVQMKNNGILVKLANAISWSQNENDAANVSLLPFIIIGAGHGTMSVKVSDVQSRPS